GRASSGVALDDVQLAVPWIAVRAVGQLPRKRGALQEGLALHQVARLSRRLPGAGRGEGLLDDAAALGRSLVQVLEPGVGEDRRDLALDLRLAQLGLRLARELRLQPRDADDCAQAIAHGRTGA